jgi:hypothetical protein
MPFFLAAISSDYYDLLGFRAFMSLPVLGLMTIV